MEIRVAVEDISSVKKKLVIEIPADAVSGEYESVSRSWLKEARIPGFRQGRAPLGLVKQTYRKEIRQELIRKLLPESFHQAVEQQGWHPVGEPAIGEVKLPEGGSMRYEAQLEVLPELKLPPYEGIQIADIETAVSPQEIAEALQELRERKARLEAVEDRPIQVGDRATIDLNGEYLSDSEDSEEPLPESVSNEAVEVEVGGENTHEAFTTALTGMNLAEEKTFDVSYPEDYPEKKLAGRRVRFTAEVTNIQAKVLPELDDELARSFGDFESLEALQEKVRTDLQDQKESGREAQLRNRLVAKLVEQTGFEIPDSLIEERIDRKVRELAYNISSRGVDLARAGLDWPRIRQDMRPRAENEVRGELILDQIAEEQRIEVTPAAEGEELSRAAQSMNAPLEQVRAYFGAEGRMEGLRVGIRRRLTLDWLRKQAVIG